MDNTELLLQTASSTLQKYGIENANIERLGGYDNVNFKVNYQDEIYVLRVRVAERHTKETVKAELIWLSALKETTNLNIAKPIENLEGQFITIAALENKDTLCTLMNWVEGKVPPTIDSMSDKQIESIGSVMAQLHEQSKQFEKPDNFDRTNFNGQFFQQRLDALITALEKSDLSKEELKSFKTMAKQAMIKLNTLTPDKTNFGLIHADFHSGNYLIDGDKVNIIDFDNCGFGFYIYDLSLALMELEESKRELFLTGYKSVITLPPAYDELNQLFLFLSFVDNLGFFAPDPEELPFILAELPLVAKALQNAVGNKA